MLVYHAMNLFAGEFNSAYWETQWAAVRQNFNAASVYRPNGFFINRPFGESMQDGNECYPCWDQWRKLCEWVRESASVAAYFATARSPINKSSHTNAVELASGFRNSLPFSFKYERDGRTPGYNFRTADDFHVLWSRITGMISPELIRNIDGYAHRKAFNAPNAPSLFWYGGVERSEYQDDSVAVCNDLGPLQGCAHSIGVLDGIVKRLERYSAYTRFRNAWANPNISPWVEAIPDYGSVFASPGITAFATVEAWQRRGGWDTLKDYPNHFVVWWWQDNGHLTWDELLRQLRDANDDDTSAEANRLTLCTDVLMLTAEQRTQLEPLSSIRQPREKTKTAVAVKKAPTKTTGDVEDDDPTPID